MEWKKKALEKQLSFKKSRNLNSSGTHGGKHYEHILSDNDALNGANFYCYRDEIELKNLQEWAFKSKGKKVKFDGGGLKNLLRSEHIPYNIFYPLEKLRIETPDLLNRFLESLFDGKIKVDKVVRIKVEFASDADKKQLLNDNTSFDTYFEYMDGNDLCGIGIEVKYTEKSYPYGKTEKQMMFDQSSPYNSLTKKCGYYIDKATVKLAEKNLKQPWRNHLLGIKLVENGLLKKFHSVLLYPEGNDYQFNVINAYTECLTEMHKDSFKGLTFETFINKAEAILKSPESTKWLSYLKDRY